MKNIYLFILIVFFLASCNSRYIVVPSNKVTSERKLIAQNFIETYLKKCDNKDYSALGGFNISKKFEAKLVSDSLEKNCERIVRTNGKITIEKFVSAHTFNSPKDFLDVFNFKIKTEKGSGRLFLHLGMYRDQNFIEVPFYISEDESYYETIRKKYYK